MNAWGWIALIGGIAIAITIIVLIVKGIWKIESEELLCDRNGLRIFIGFMIGVVFDFIWLIIINKNTFGQYFPIRIQHLILGDSIFNDLSLETISRFSRIWLYFAPIVGILLSINGDRYSFIFTLIFTPLIVLIIWGFVKSINYMINGGGAWLAGIFGILLIGGIAAVIKYDDLNYIRNLFDSIFKRK